MTDLKPVWGAYIVILQGHTSLTLPPDVEMGSFGVFSPREWWVDSLFGGSPLFGLAMTDLSFVTGA